MSELVDIPDGQRITIDQDIDEFFWEVEWVDCHTVIEGKRGRWRFFHTATDTFRLGLCRAAGESGPQLLTVVLPTWYQAL